MSPDWSLTSSPDAEELAHLRLLQLADSALPIGSLAHSFGLETLVSSGLLSIRDIPGFLLGYLEEAGAVDAVFCRAGFRLAGPGPFSAEKWLGLNGQLSARKPGRETRAASAALGQNFLRAVAALTNRAPLHQALEASKQSSTDCASVIHHAPAFGLAAGTLGVFEERAVQAHLHQSVANLVSAFQRLLPLGQSDAMRILWDLKPAILEAAARSASGSPDGARCFMPLLDWGAMEHPALSTRLFIS